MTELSRARATSAVLVPLKVDPASATPLALTVKISGEHQTTGKVLSGYFLPGDTNDDGKVNTNDIDAIWSSMGSVAGESTYKFDADANRDGRVSAIDLMLAKYNEGAGTNVTPIVTADLNPVSDSGTADRKTVYKDVVFEGKGTPGARITFTEGSGKIAPASTVIGGDGTYSLTISLAPGDNTFNVTSQDAFGQTISGSITPVTYLEPLVPVESPKPAPKVDTGGEKAPSTPTDPVSVRYQLLQQTYPNAFKTMSSDQAQQLRLQIASRLG